MVTLSLVSDVLSCIVTTQTQYQVQSSFLLDFAVHFCTCSQSVFCDRQFSSVANYCTLFHRGNGSFEVLSSHEETRTANACIAPEVTRPQAGEAQLSTRVSTMRSQETELQGQLQKLRQENNRINALMNHLQNINSSVNTGDQGLAQQLQPSQLEPGRAQTEVSHL